MFAIATEFPEWEEAEVACTQGCASVKRQNRAVALSFHQAALKAEQASREDGQFTSHRDLVLPAAGSALPSSITPSARGLVAALVLSNRHLLSVSFSLQWCQDFYQTSKPCQTTLAGLRSSGVVAVTAGRSLSSKLTTKVKFFTFLLPKHQWGL